MNIQKLDHVGIRVMDVNRPIEFYKKFGFKTTRKDNKKHVFVLKHQNAIELNLLDGGQVDNNGKNVLEININYPGYTHYAIEVESVVDAKQFIKSVGIPITEGPVTFGDGKTSVFIRDPDMNVNEFTELPK